MKQIDDRIAFSLNITKEWTYRNVPWCSEKEWERLFDVWGDSNVRMLSSSARQEQDGSTSMRGDFFVSPEGVKRAVKKGTN